MGTTIGPKQPSTYNLENNNADAQGPANDKVQGPFPYGVSPNPGKDSLSVMVWGNNNPGQRINEVNNDRAHTMEITVEAKKSYLSEKQLTEIAGELAYRMFTANRQNLADPSSKPYWGPGGYRAEMATLKISVRNTTALGDGYFLKKGANVTGILTGPLGGKDIQRNWHSATGMGQTRGLPDQYTQGVEVGGSAGVELSVWKREDFKNGISLEAGVGGGADVPVNTGIGNVRTEAQAGVGYGGFQFNMGVTGALQWTPGSAFNFPTGGGPAEGFYVSPFAEGSWRNDKFEIKFKAVDNSLGTGTPFCTATVTFFFK